MIIYRPTKTNPYFNLATEEYLIDIFDGTDIFMLWRNEPCVVIGKNQNAYAEVNRAFAEEKGIKVVRRLTGGGAVFHDLGNVNFTFITKEDETTGINYSVFCEPIIQALKKLGIDASLSGRNDILANGLKVSGNAQCRRNGCILSHGTLLWSADFSYMQGVLNPDPEKLKAKGIKSVSSRVGNIRDMIGDGFALSRSSTSLDFVDYLEKAVPGEKREFDDAALTKIRKLTDEKYSTWEWDYGASPALSTVKKKRFSYGGVEIFLEANHGLIKAINFFGDFFGVKDVSEIENKLIGLKYEKCDLIPALEDIGDYINGSCAEDIAKLILE